MGYVEIADGISNRRIRVPNLEGIVRIEADDGPRVIVPSRATVARSDPEANGGGRA